MDLLAFNEEQLYDIFFHVDSPMYKYIMTNVSSPIYDHYKKSACENNPTNNMCSNRQLTFSQWAFGDVLSNPMPCMPKHIVAGGNYSYVHEFPFLTHLNFTPELSYYVYKSNSA